MIKFVSILLLAAILLSNAEVVETRKEIIQDAKKDYLEEFERLGIQCPEVVIAQMVHETDFFNSDICKKGNNLFGMKKAYIRPHYQEGVYKGHAKYFSKSHSLLDYIEYQKFVGGNYLRKRNKEKFNNTEEYLQFLLDVGYAEDEKYIRKLRKYLNIINND